MSRMECSITDGLQYDDWLEGEPEREDEDAAYERARQEEIDDERDEDLGLYPTCCEPQELQEILFEQEQGR